MTENFPNTFILSDRNRFLNEREEVLASGLPTLESVADYLKLMTPYTVQIPSTVPHLFLMQVPHLSVLNKNGRWIVRDGLIPLLHFFERFSAPTGVRSELLISERWISFVPQEWRSRCCAYRVTGKRKPTGSELWIIGAVSNTFVSAERWTMWSERIRQLCENLSYPNLKIWMPSRHSGLEDFQYEWKYYQEFLQKLPRLPQPLSLEDTQNLNADLSNVDFVVINDEHCLSNDAVTHKLLSRGAARAFSPSQTCEEIERIGQSDLHGYEVIQDNSSHRGQNQDLSRILLEVRLGKAFRHLPWSKWFVDWSGPLVDGSRGVC